MPKSIISDTQCWSTVPGPGILQDVPKPAAADGAGAGAEILFLCCLHRLQDKSVLKGNQAGSWRCTAFLSFSEFNQSRGNLA